MARRQRWLIGGGVVLAMVTSPAWSQETGTGGNAPRTSGGLPRENIGNIARRSPSIMTRDAPVSSGDITQTAEERDSRPRETRKLSVQILLSILDGLQRAIMQFLGSTTLPTINTPSTPTPGPTTLPSAPGS